jgi:hypothetical protein
VIRCSVANCDFLAESTIEDFAVCALHDHDAVRGILDRLMTPAAFWFSDGRPIVIPVGPLTEAHLIPQLASLWATRAADDQSWPMQECPDGPGKCLPEYDLTR